MKITLDVNNKIMSSEADASTPLLWFLRDELGLTGTKFGCGMAQCGACTVLVDGQAIRSCVTPASSVQEKKVTTIEGVNSKEANAVKQAWDELAVPQCGYCQSGQIMSATALLSSNSKPTDEDIDEFISGNICRCSTYARIKKAVKVAANNLSDNNARVNNSQKNAVVYFTLGEEQSYVD